MTRPSIIIASRLALAALMIVPTLPASANETGWYLRKQQQEQCERDGGRYDYPKCHYPDRSKPQERRTDEACDFGCQLVLGLIGAAMARAAYCKANPDKC